MVSIRAAVAAEAGLLTELALRSKAHWGYDEAFMASCRAELTVTAAEVAPRRARVAVEDGRILGFTTLEGEAPQGDLGMCFVAPEAMGRGVGRLLFQAVLREAAALGFRRLEIASDPHAEAFYLAMGAVRSGSTPSGSIPGRVLPLLSCQVV
ncbi:GNAT family N-acetyltransferase [Streptacidiphilus griseoplanus]|uniref:GNAT family N-acetyltransferase n=1 Tax=Peterkaempfera griseoplana TaxID=66896 RepID=UPI0006E412E4|nr:GNAT family N-acetyltransferase [Peterkaempfera griseoplana]